MGQAVRRAWCRGVALASVLLAAVVGCLAFAGAANAYVYWANDGATSTTIGRANLNGTGANENFITGGKVPCFVAVDASHVYWANTNGTTIGRANLNGTGVNQNFITGANEPCGVDLRAPLKNIPDHPNPKRDGPQGRPRNNPSLPDAPLLGKNLTAERNAAHSFASTLPQ